MPPGTLQLPIRPAMVVRGGSILRVVGKVVCVPFFMIIGGIAAVSATNTASHVAATTGGRYRSSNTHR